MNENIDLTKILEGCPIGTEFYHLAYGKVWLTGIDLDAEHPIKLSLHDDNYTNVTVTKEGLHCIHYPGECVFFPSKDQRDWSKFERFWDNPKVEVEKFDPSYSISDSTDWLNKNHFDFRNLIDKNLAIDCTNLNIY